MLDILAQDTPGWPCPLHLPEIDTAFPGEEPHRGSGKRLFRRRRRRNWRCRSGFCNLGLGRFGNRRLRNPNGLSLADISRRFYPYQRGLDRDTVSDIACKPGDGTIDGRRNFHGGLVGHDRGDHHVLADGISCLHVPLHELGLGDPFPDIGHLDDEFAHGSGLHDFGKRPPDAAGTGK